MVSSCIEFEFEFELWFWFFFSIVDDKLIDVAFSQKKKKMSLNVNWKRHRNVPTPVNQDSINMQLVYAAWHVLVL